MSIVQFIILFSATEGLLHLESMNKMLDIFFQLFAVLSAMQCASLFRLTKTWSHLNRRDRQVFDKMTEMFSERDNFARLREHMDKTALKHQA